MNEIKNEQTEQPKVIYVERKKNHFLGKQLENMHFVVCFQACVDLVEVYLPIM